MLPAEVFNDLATFKRRTLTIDSIGDSSETYNVVASGVRVSIQKRHVTDGQSVEKSGAVFPGTHVVYFNDPGFTPENKDQIISSGGTIFEVVSLLKLVAPGGDYYFKVETNGNEPTA